MCRYCEFREQNPELHIDVHPFLLSKLGEDDIVSVTPYRDQNGRRIMIYKFGNWRPSKIPVDDIFRASLILFEMGALEPQSQVLGGVGECHVEIVFGFFSFFNQIETPDIIIRMKNVFNFRHFRSRRIVFTTCVEFIANRCEKNHQFDGGELSISLKNDFDLY